VDGKGNNQFVCHFFPHVGANAGAIEVQEYGGKNFRLFFV